MAALSEKAAHRVASIFKRAELGDPRRRARAVELAGDFAEAPGLSLPKIWSTPSVLKAGYQFLRNPRNEFSLLMEAVQLAARDAALQARRVLVLHDTTDVTCPCAEPDEVGYLQTGKAGFYVHHAFCVSADAENRPLGMLWSDIWGRAQRSLARKRNLSGPELAKLKHRESDRWLESITQSQLWAEGCDEVVHVMDREADFFRLFEHMADLGADFVVRLRHDRATEESRLTERLVDAPIKLERLVELSARKHKTMPSYTHQGRAARKALLTVRCERVEFQPLKHMPNSEPVQVNIVQVLEENPPPGQRPIAWVLATSLPIKTKADVGRVIDIYRARWQIEELHKALKTGCLLEKRQLESFESLTTLLAICYPTACELLRIRSRSRQTGLPASDVLRQSLLDCLRVHPKARPLAENPTAEQALAVIAGLGGHIKHNGPPGWQTLAAGYTALLAFEQGWLAAHSKRDF